MADVRRRRSESAAATAHLQVNRARLIRVVEARRRARALAQHRLQWGAAGGRGGKGTG